MGSHCSEMSCTWYLNTDEIRFGNESCFADDYEHKVRIIRCSKYSVRLWMSQNVKVEIVGW
jgi:hypothetical protein